MGCQLISGKRPPANTASAIAGSYAWSQFMNQCTTSRPRPSSSSSRTTGSMPCHTPPYVKAPNHACSASVRGSAGEGVRRAWGVR
jgi:hypothetical protein